MPKIIVQEMVRQLRQCETETEARQALKLALDVADESGLYKRPLILEELRQALAGAVTAAQDEQERKHLQRLSRIVIDV